MSEGRRATLRRSAAPVALMAAIFYLSAQSDPGPEIGGLARVLAHATEYALLAALWAWALAPVASWRRRALTAAAVSLAYAVSDEYHQSFVPGREADPLDVAVDAAGIGLALLAIGLRLGARGAAGRSR